MLKDLLADGVRSRLAPTPSGFLHAGNGMNFILTWALTRAFGGRLLLRIDDLDKARYRREYVEDIFATLEWLGIDYDEGPESVEDFEQKWSQHHRLERYAKLLTELRAEGLLFACDCSRRAIRSISPNGNYPGTCLKRNLPFEQEKVAWRIQAPAAAQAVTVIDWKEGYQNAELYKIDAFVVRQKNGFPAYQIASLADDVYFGINFIVRGKDLWESTLSQLYLANVLRQDDFSDCRFFHHSLLRDDNGEKMSKSAGSNALRTWREEGRPPSFLYQLAAPLLGLQLGISDGQELVQAIQERYVS